tara:strand:- start:5 stop:496 length:492 start_codon:yes stop_codon:yes gene_type:complete
MNNTNLIILITILGILILSSYYYFISKNNSEINEKLWANINKKYRSIYIVMMLAATIGFLSLVYYISNNKIENKLLFTIVLMFILIPAIFWMGLTYESIKINKKSGYVSLVLLLTAFASVYMSVLLNKMNVNNITQILFGLFTFHVTILDGFIWNYKYNIFFD